MRRASEAERAWLAEMFVELCRIPSPFGRERACADRVAAELRALRLDVHEDETGNLLTRLSGRSERSILLCAHLDTVEVSGPIEPVLEDGAYTNQHDAILGADNKAAVAMLLAVARRCAIEGAPTGLELLFTVGEEDGLVGAKAFDAGRLRSELGYVFDHATPIGEIVLASPTYYRLGAEFHGQAAHAGIRPEEGRSAILAAARAIAAMPHGRVDEQTTANVGSIQGGSPSTNVVAGNCHFTAEARSLDAEHAEHVVTDIVDAINDAAAETECDVDLTCERLFTGYRLRSSAPAVCAAEAALRACGYEPRPIVSGGGSDANALQQAGVQCVNLANGTERNHEPGERVSVAALEGMLDVTFALLEEA